MRTTAFVSGTAPGIGRAVAGGRGPADAATVINGRSAKTVEAALRALRTDLPDARPRGAAAEMAHRRR